MKETSLERELRDLEREMTRASRLPEIRGVRPAPLPAHKRNVLPQRHILTIRIPERLTDLCTMQAHNSPDLCGRVIDYSSANLDRGWVVEFVIRRMNRRGGEAVFKGRTMWGCWVGMRRCG